LKLGEDSCAEIFDGNTVEPAWVWAAEKIERDDVVAVLGRPDSGKTSYTTLAANIAVSKYGRCSVVSLDPGQTYFTPPTVVGAAAVEKQVYDLAELKPFWQVPVGTTSAPHGAAVILEMLVGLAERLVRPVLVDMDGWVEGSAAAAHKSAILKTLRCTKAVLLNLEKETVSDAVSEAGIAVLSIPASGHVRQRAPEERKRIREWLYRRFLGDLSLRIIPRTWVELKAVGFQGLGPEELYSQAERRLGETVGESANMLRKRGGLVCYLYDSHNTYTSLALFCGVDRERDAVKVLCQTCQGVKRILVGRVFLTADGEEQFTLD
jgi:polynucleotide 5'-kinase involved in rRNA processing